MVVGFETGADACSRFLVEVGGVVLGSCAGLGASESRVSGRFSIDVLPSSSGFSV